MHGYVSISLLCIFHSGYYFKSVGGKSQVIFLPAQNLQEPPPQRDPFLYPEQPLYQRLGVSSWGRMMSFVAGDGKHQLPQKNVEIYRYQPPIITNAVTIHGESMGYLGFHARIEMHHDHRTQP